MTERGLKYIVAVIVGFSLIAIGIMPSLVHAQAYVIPYGYANSYYDTTYYNPSYNNYPYNSAGSYIPTIYGTTYDQTYYNSVSGPYYEQSNPYQYPQYQYPSAYPIYPHVYYEEPLTVKCYADVPSTQVNTYVNWRAIAAGGSHQYTYRWNGEGIVYNNSNSNPTIAYYNIPGTKSASVTVESAGRRVTQYCSPLSVIGQYYPYQQAPTYPAFQY